MKIIISPAKKMKIENDSMLPVTAPDLLEDTEKLYGILKKMKREELQKLWTCNEKIASLNYERLHFYTPKQAVSPALLSYEGIQYQYMAPQVFTEDQWEYVNDHLRILSGLYGVLRPLDRVVPYRLEMQAKLAAEKAKDLYGFWGDKIYQTLLGEDQVILNLASKEYSRVIEKYLTPGAAYYTCIFGEYQDGKVKVKGTQAKMARGEMVRFLSQNRITDPEEIKEFTGLGYRYSKKESTLHTLVFLKGEGK